MKLISNFKKNDFFKGVVAIAGGAAMAQVISVLSLPLITRLYLPEEMGVLTLFTSLLTMLIVFSSLRYEITIPLPKEDKKAIDLLVLSFVILVLFSLLSLIILIIINLYYPSIIHPQFIYLIPIGVFFTGLYQILNKWALRKKNYQIIGKTTLVQSIVGNSGKIGFGLLGLGPLGLLIGQIIAVSGGFISLVKQTLHKNLFNEVSIKSIFIGLKRYYKFPLYTGPAKIILNITTMLPPLFLTATFGLSVTGQYGLAYSVSKLPMSLIGRSVANVFYSEAASIGKNDPEKIKQLTKKLQPKLVGAAIIPLIILLVGGPFLFTLIFGDQWVEAGEFARLLAIMIFFNFVTTPISDIAAIFEKLRALLILNVIRLLIVLVVFTLSATLDWSPHNTILIYAIGMSINYLSLYFLAQYILNQAIKSK